MARGVNKVILVGHIGQDPEVRYLPNGSAVANISLATTDSWKDKQTGQQKERTEWHRIAIHGKLAEIAGQYLRKGSQLYIEGSLQTHKWEDSRGQTQYTTQIVVNVNGQMQMLGNANNAGHQNQQYGLPNERSQLSNNNIYAPLSPNDGMNI